MLRVLASLVLAAGLCAQAPGSKAADSFGPLRFLVGEWTGEGDGQPGKGSGATTFRFELEGKALVRRNSAEYPAAKDRPAFHHEDLMTVFAEAGDLKALYLDNEGHVIRYLVSGTAEGAVFVSEPGDGPSYRLTYLRRGEGRLGLRFELAPAKTPMNFRTYIEAELRRAK
jgi:hypothetical protein